MSLAQLCRRAGCDYTYLWRIIHADTAAGRRYLRPSYALTQRLGEVLDAPREALAAAGYAPAVTLGEAQVEDRLARLQQDLDGLRATVSRGEPAEWPLRRLPVLGRIPAGPLREAVEAPDGQADLPADVAGDAAYLLRVVGDSMAPTLLDGDLVAVRPQTTAEAGEIVVALIGGEGTVKRYDPAQGVPMLRADNPQFPSVPLGTDGEIAGVVCAGYRPAEQLRRLRPSG
jgi:repressor LexA